MNKLNTGMLTAFQLRSFDWQNGDSYVLLRFSLELSGIKVGRLPLNTLYKEVIEQTTARNPMTNIGLRASEFMFDPKL